MIHKRDDYVYPEDQVPRATRLGSRVRDARVKITPLAYLIIADISAICGYNSNLLTDLKSSRRELSFAVH